MLIELSSSLHFFFFCSCLVLLTKSSPSWSSISSHTFFSYLSVVCGRPRIICQRSDMRSVHCLSYPLSPLWPKRLSDCIVMAAVVRMCEDRPTTIIRVRYSLSYRSGLFRLDRASYAFIGRIACRSAGYKCLRPFYLATDKYLDVDTTDTCG